jgi:hypothetical protein
MEEYKRLQDEISSLEDFILHEMPMVRVSFKGLFTLVDGKVVCAITGFSSDKCSQCGKGRKELRRKDSDFDPVVNNFQFGVSILHFGIRTFETLLKIGYKKELKIFTAQEAKMDSLQFKEKVSKGELLVKKRFQDELGLVVDRARPGGFGSTNTGNVARRACSAAVTTASICGVSAVLVTNLETIWKTLASGLKDMLLSAENYLINKLTPK